MTLRSILEHKSSLSRTSTKQGSKEPLTLVIIVISMEVHAPRFAVVPGIAVSKEMVKEPPDDEVSG